MMKRFFAAMLVAVLLVAMLPQVSLAGTTYASVVGGWLRLRSGASFNASTITSYYTGTTVEVLSQTGKWYHVRTPDGRTGYMYGDYLKMGSAPSGGTNAWVTSHNGYGVRLRKGPSTSYSTIRTYAVGTPVRVLQHGTYWCKLNVGGTVGYMMTQFLQFDGYHPDPSEPVIGYATIWSGNGYGVRLRTGPGKGYSKIGVYSVGTTVSILQKGAVWDRIRVGGRVGWMMNEFLHYQNNNEVTHVALNTLSPSVGTVMSMQAVTPSGATVSYEWMVDGVVKATSSTYTVTDADVGKQIQLRVKGTGNYKGTALSAQTNKVLSDTEVTNLKLNTTAPVVGDKLTATFLPAGATVAYAWKVDGYQVSNESSYTTVASDVGKQVTLIVTGTGSYHGTVSASTAAVAASANVTDVSIVNTTTTAGVPTVGDTLATSLSPSQATVTYQWNRDGGAIAGATGSSYTLTDADEGKKITVTVKGTGAYAGEKTSAATEAVLPKPTVPVIEVKTLPEGTVGKNYSAFLSASGGGTVTWKLVDGSSLPGGLTMGDDGVITGQPTTEGSTTFFVIASNSAGNSEPKSFTIAVQKDVVPTTYSLTIGTAAPITGLAADARVDISASEPAATEVFSGWTIVSGAGTFENPAVLNTVFVMNGQDTVIKANYAPKTTTYTLTVENGTGGQSGLVGNESLTITARTPGTNEKFTGWTLKSGAGNFENSTALTTTFQMLGSDATICANYETVPVPVTYALTVENGEGSQTGLAIDAKVEIRANAAPEGQEFAKWELVSGNGNFHTATNPNTTFTLNGTDATVRATYRTAGTYTLTVENGTGDAANLAADAVVNISAEVPEGYEFVKWVLVSGTGNFHTSTNASTTFHMNGQDAVISAELQELPKTYTLTVEGGTGGGTGLSGDADITITAGDTPSGKEFTGWTITSGTGTIADPSAKETTFKLSNSDATVTANYADITYTLTVENGTGGDSGLTGSAEVTIKANEAPSGKKFTGWTITSGTGTITDPSAAETTFRLNGEDATVEATYETVPQKLAAPTVTWVDANSVSWTSVEGATGYVFYRTYADGRPDSSVHSVSSSETSYNIKNAGQTGDTFYVQAVGNDSTLLDSDWGSGVCP